MKRLSFLCTVVFFILSFNATIAQNNRQRMFFDAGWKFSQTDTIGADKAVFNDSKWRKLNLPHDWSIENEFIQNAPTGGGGGYLPTGIGWYRKSFNVPKTALSKTVRIEFDGVYQNSDVWINGHHLGHYGAPAALRLSVDRTTIDADSKDSLMFWTKHQSNKFIHSTVCIINYRSQSNLKII